MLSLNFYGGDTPIGQWQYAEVFAFFLSIFLSKKGQTRFSGKNVCLAV